MKKLPKKPIIYSLSIFLILSSILCCCVGIVTTVQAANVESAHSEHCHSHEANGSSQSPGAEECECHYSDAILANIDTEALKSDLLLARTLKETFLLNVSISSSPHAFFVFYEHASPRLYKRSVPFYLENSILRI